MSILDLDEEDNVQEPLTTPPPVEKASANFQTIATDFKTVDRKAITMFMEGSTWEVRYYQQFLGKDDESAAQALDRDAVYQSYRRIDKLKLKVTDPIQYTQDQTIKDIFSVSGSAGLMGVIAPNKGDMFVADDGNGRNLIFTVTAANRSTALMNSVYTIEYKAVAYWDKEREADFERKTIQHYVFDGTGLLNGCSAFVTPKDADRLATYAERLGTLLDQYLADFYSFDTSTLLVPDQTSPTYDHFVVKFILQLFDVTQDVRLAHCTQYNVGSDRALADAKTVWDALIQRNEYPLMAGITHAAITPTRYMRGRPALQAIGYMGIDQIVYPVEPQTGVDARYRNRDIVVNELTPVEEGGSRRRDQIDYERHGTYNDLIIPVVVDSHYVFSRGFYERTPASILERVALQAMRREQISLDYIDRLIEAPWEWSSLERYYYYPVLMYLLKTIVERKNGN